MVNVEKIFEEALDVISDGQDELSETKKVIYDKKNGQASVKIPKRFSLKKGLNKDSIFEIVFNPNKETMEEAQQSGLIIFVKKGDDSGKGKERT